MQKFKVGDIIQDDRIASRGLIMKGKILSFDGICYIVEIIEDTFYNSIGSINHCDKISIDKICVLVESLKPIAGDCVCVSYDLLHKGCTCGYSRSLGSKFGLAYAD